MTPPAHSAARPPDRTDRKRSIFRPTLGYAVSALIGLFLATQVPKYGPVILLKIVGRGDACPWYRVLYSAVYEAESREGIAEAKSRIRRVAIDPELPIEQWLLPGHRSYWIPRGGNGVSAKDLLCYLISDLTVVDRRFRRQGVQAGDIVLDCGAHVGVFTDVALRRGATKVVAVEPDPLNRECLARNFAAEISTGRVVVLPQGVWDRRGRLEFRSEPGNSATGRIVAGGLSGATTEVTTVDDIAQEQGLPRVDFIKLDIEGAERNALSGAKSTLRTFGPRLMMDAYHRPDDPVVLPRLLRATRAEYRTTCGPCEVNGGKLIPHILFSQ